MHVRYDRTPNPNALKFTFDHPQFDGRVEVKKEDNPQSPLLSQLIAIEGVDYLFGYHDFLTVNKSEETSWDELLPLINKTFEDN